MKRVLVTGASGFIGGHTLPLLLQAGYEVHAAARHIPTADPHLAVHWHQADLLESTQVDRLFTAIAPTHLLHMAWVATPKLYWSSPDNLRWLQASLDLVQQFELHGGQRMIVAGTCAEYDWRYGYLSEQVTPLQPTTLYGTSKNALQSVLSAYTQQKSDFSVAWGRMFFTFGPHEHPDRVVPYVIRALLKGETARCSAGTQVRDFLYVEDAAAAFVALLDSQVKGAVNVCSGRSSTLRQILELVATKLDRLDAVHFGAIPASASEPNLLIGDTTRLNSEVGWSPAFSLDQAVQRTVDWWREHLLERRTP
ncbi:MAG: NAD(P)-dependent oxidoreductase [Anaerolineae bacterium]|nr:NAD(P)-dependent oxidoreductase [Anaerolineae bacterium]